MTTLAELTNEQLKALVVQAERVILTGEQLANTYQTNDVIEKLDKAWEKCPRMASTPPLLALQCIAQKIPRPEFPFVLFLNPDYREDSFDRLFRRVQQISVRTIKARSCYSRQTEVFDRQSFDSLTRKQQQMFSDYVDFMQQINDCVQIIKELHSLIVKK